MTRSGSGWTVGGKKRDCFPSSFILGGHVIGCKADIKFLPTFGPHIQYLFNISVGPSETGTFSTFKSNTEGNKGTRLSHWERRSELEILS